MRAFNEYGTDNIEELTPGWALVLDMALAAFEESIEGDNQAARRDVLRRAGMSAPRTA